MVNDIVFSSVGDFGNKKNRIKNILSMIKESNADFFLALGDFFYKKNKAIEWINLSNQEETLKHLFEEDIYPIIGNHDDTEKKSPKSLKDIINAFKGDGNIRENGYYYFKRENILFIMLYTRKKLQSGGPMHSFVKKILDENKDDPDIKWRIICYHKPSVTTKGDHHEPEKIIQEHYHNIFDKYKVDVILAGHNHNFSLTHPIDHTTSPDGSKPRVIDSSGGPIYNNVNGRIFITIGTGGKSLRSIDVKNRHYPNNDHINKTIEEFGIVLFELNDNGNRLDCRFIYENGSGDENLFSIIK
ncbi:MAG: metallophosphoesterase family protein [Nitrososphaeraceae archaeon]